MSAAASTPAGRNRGYLPLIALCGMFLVAALIVMPPYRPGQSWQNANVLKGAVIYLSMSVLGAFCSLLAVALELGALHLGGGRPRAIRFGELLEASAPQASAPLALMLLFVGQSFLALPAAVSTTGWSLLAAASAALCARSYKAQAARAGAAVRWKPALALLVPATGVIALAFFPLWLMAAALLVNLIA